MCIPGGHGMLWKIQWLIVISSQESALFNLKVKFAALLVNSFCVLRIFFEEEEEEKQYHLNLI